MSAAPADRIRHLVIVAGGKGQRISELYPDTPKTLIPVGGKPVLQHQLELAARSGVETVNLFVGHLAEQVIAFAGDGERFGLQVKCYVETAPLGSAGAVLAALEELPEQFFVLYGDVMAAVDLERMGAFHLDRHGDFTTFVHPNDHPFDSDLVETDAEDRVTAIHGYPHPEDAVFANLANAACYAVRRDALRPFADLAKPDFARDILAGLVARGARVLAYRSTDYIKDMGSPARLQRVERDWQAGRIRPPGSAGRPAVFLDRDGTLNEERGYIRRPEDLTLLPGAGPALKRLREAGFLLVVVTNQGAIAHGEATEAEVADVHRRLEWDLGAQGAYLDAIYLCPHHPQSPFPNARPELQVICDCRKPAPGLIERACADFNIDRARSWMVGDHTRDVEAGRRAGLRALLLRTGHGGIDGTFAVRPDQVVDDIAAAAERIVTSATTPAR
jgi:histidinol-phosphate phosphatase family protein